MVLRRSTSRLKGDLLELFAASEFGFLQMNFKRRRAHLVGWFMKAYIQHRSCICKIFLRILLTVATVSNLDWSARLLGRYIIIVQFLAGSSAFEFMATSECWWLRSNGRKIYIDQSCKRKNPVRELPTYIIPSQIC